MGEVRRLKLTGKSEEEITQLLHANPSLSEHLTDAAIAKLAEELASGAPEIRIDAESGQLLDDHGAATGKTIEDLAKEFPFGWKILKGDEKQITLDVGAPPEENLISSSVVIPRLEKALEGQFPVGAKVRIEIEIEIEDVGVKRVRDKDGFIIGLHRLHVATSGGVERRQ